MPEKCHVVKCPKPSVSRGLCDTHRKRRERHGHTDQTRPEDWGARERHPAYSAWRGLQRYHKNAIPPSWFDFWNFVSDVPERPSDDARSFRPDPSIPWSASNFYWKEPRVSPDARRRNADYMREWQRRSRAADPDYYKDAYLRKRYGVSMGWYREQFDRQNGTCAICLREETAVIRGKRLSLAVDHCHDTGAVRGLLCRSCNNAIGMLKHDVAVLQRATEYLSGETSCVATQ